MVKWIGYSIYKADNPADPKHLADYWIADHGTLIKFESAPKGEGVDVTYAPVCRPELDAGCRAWREVPLSFVLDTGASNMTVTSEAADWLSPRRSRAMGF